MVNVFDLLFEFNSTLGYLSTDERLCSLQIQNLSRPCSTIFDPILQNQTFSVKRAFVPHTTEGELLLKLIIGLDNEVVPSSLNLTCSMFSESGRHLFGHNWTNLSTGCFEGCAVCYSSDTQKCMKCLPNYDTSNETGCELRVPRVPYFEMLRRINIINRRTTVSIISAGIALTCLLHLFVVKTSSGEVSPYIISKICISNVSSVALATIFVQDLLAEEDNSEAVFTQWTVRIFVSLSFIINCIAYCCYQGLSYNLAFMSLRNRRFAAKMSFGLAALVFGFHNLMQFSAKVQILLRLQSASLQIVASAKPAEQSEHQTDPLLRPVPVPLDNSDEAEIEVRRRRSNSSNLDMADHAMESRSVKSSEDRHQMSSSRFKPADAKSRQTRKSDAPPEFGLLDFFEFLRWLNIGMKSCLLLVSLLIAATCAPRFWSWDRPCVLYAVLVFEVCLYLIPLRRLEASWNSSRNEQLAPARLNPLDQKKQASPKRDGQEGEEPQSSLAGSAQSVGRFEAPPAQQSANRTSPPAQMNCPYELILDSMLRKSRQTLEDLVNEDSSDTDSYAEGFERYLKDTGKTEVDPKTKFNYFLNMMQRANDFPLRKSSEGSDEDSDFEYGEDKGAAEVDLQLREDSLDQAASREDRSSQQP